MSDKPEIRADFEVHSGDGELVRTGITDTFNPTNMDRAIDGLVKLVVKQMQRDGAP